MNADFIYPCPRCQTPKAWHNNPFKPFCSQKCKLIDLGAWASESYKIESSDTPFSDELTTKTDHSFGG